jgi:pimeloyl-ACP methyl ester carboxylesterase
MMIAQILALLSAAVPALVQAAPLGPNLERFDYPFPVHWYEAPSQGQTVRMAYMDLQPSGAPNGKTVVLLHGKNFCGATWGDTPRRWPKPAIG